jgi:hypothetical protein
VDCPHATTQGWLIPGPVTPTDADLIRHLLERHRAEEGCRCTRGLRRRYGLFERDQ